MEVYTTPAAYRGKSFPEAYTRIQSIDPLYGRPIDVHEYSEETRRLVTPHPVLKDHINERILTAQALIANNNRFYTTKRAEHSRPRFLAGKHHLFIGHPIPYHRSLRTTTLDDRTLGAVDAMGHATIKEELQRRGITLHDELTRVGSVTANGEGHNEFYGLIYFAHGSHQAVQDDLFTDRGVTLKTPLELETLRRQGQLTRWSELILEHLQALL